MWKLIFIVLFVISSQNITSQNKVKKVNIDYILNRIKSTDDTIFVINFWATWCKPCVEEMPIIANIPTTYKNKPVKVLLASLDFPNQIESKLIPFLKENYIYNEVMVLDQSNPNKWIPEVSKDWSGAIPACWFVYQNKELFHEGQITPDKIDESLNYIIE